jgi:hypothetical protein
MALQGPLVSRLLERIQFSQETTNMGQQKGCCFHCGVEGGEDDIQLLEQRVHVGKIQKKKKKKKLQ